MIKQENFDIDLQDYFDKYMGLMYYEAFKTRKYKYLIQSLAEQEGINPELLFGIILIEKINRGYWVTRFVEKFFAKLFPKYLIKKDLSIGISQIKVSTAKIVSPALTDIEIIDALLDDVNCISICSKLIKYYLEIIANITKDNEKTIFYLTSLYQTGEMIENEYQFLFFYNKLLAWCISEELLKQLLNNEEIFS